MGSSYTGLGFFAEGLQNLLNYDEVNKSNDLQALHANQANALLEDQKGEISDTLGNLIAKYKDPEWLSKTAGIPQYSLDDMDSFYKSGKSAAGAFDESYRPYDFGALGDRVSGVLSGGRLDPNQAGAAVGKFYDQAPIDTRAYLASEIAKTGAASRARESTARSTMLSRGLGQGMSLEDMGGDLSSLSMAEAQARGLSATTAGAAAEAEINKARLAKAAQQSHTYETQAGLNTDLDKTLADLLASIGKTDADVGLQAASTRGQLTSADVTQEGQQKTAAFQSFGDMLDRYTNSAMFGANSEQSLTQLIEQMRTGVAGQQASNTMGQGYTIPNFNFGDQMLQYATSVAAAKAAAPPKPNPFQSFFTLGGVLGGGGK